MAAITWRELVGQPDTGAFRALDAAGNTVNRGFDAFNRVAEEQQQANQTQQDIGRQAGVAAYLDRVQAAKTPTDLAALQSSGELDALRANIDPRDLALVRGADEKRLSSVRQNTTDAQKFQDAQTIYNNRDLVNQAQAKFATGDRDGALALLEPIKHVLPNYGDAIANGTAVADAHAHLVSQTGLEQAQSAAATSNAAATTKNAETQRQATAQSGLDKVLALKTDAVTRLGSLNKNIYGTEDGFKLFTATIEQGIGDKDKAAVMLRMGADAIGAAAQKNPAVRELPPDVVASIVLAHSKDWGSGKYNPLDMGVQGSIANELVKAVDTYSSRIDYARTARQQLGFQLQGLNGLQEEATRGAYPGFAAKLDAAAAAAKGAGVAPVPGIPGTAAAVVPGQVPAPGVVPAPATLPAATTGAQVPAPVAAVPDFKLDPALEKAAESQKVQMNLGTRRLYTPEVEKYLKAKDAAIEALNASPAGDVAANTADLFRREQQRNPTLGQPLTLSDAIARRAALDNPTKKAR